MIVDPSALHTARERSGITLTEILIAIMIMGIGMVSIATLFPLGLLKLREAARMSRSTYLTESAVADLAARKLLNVQTFSDADTINQTTNWTYPYWYASTTFPGPNYFLVTSKTNPQYPYFNPLQYDTPYYGGDPVDPASLSTTPVPLGATGSRGFGIPIAYDPLWRLQTGIYPDPTNSSKSNIPEVRFASGIGFVRSDPGDNSLPSAHGLQRLTNFNRPAITLNSQYIPSIFVSPEDLVWQDSNFKGLYPMVGNLQLSDPISGTSVDSTPSGLVPDLSLDQDANHNPVAVSDWRYSWMFTGRQVSQGASQGATFDGDIVIFENRPFALDDVSSVAPYTGQFTSLKVPEVQPAGERVVEAVFGYSGSPILVNDSGTDKFSVYNGPSGSRSVLLRWPATMSDPEIKVGNWIADVTYERNANFLSRFVYTPATAVMAPSITGQRCFWYQVVKVNPPAPALSWKNDGGNYRSMIVNVASPLRAYTPLNADGSPLHVNAALVSPYVVQVIPRTFTVN